MRLSLGRVFCFEFAVAKSFRVDGLRLPERNCGRLYYAEVFRLL